MIRSDQILKFCVSENNVIAPVNRHLNYFVERAERRIMKQKQNASTKYFA